MYQDTRIIMCRFCKKTMNTPQLIAHESICIRKKFSEEQIFRCPNCYEELPLKEIDDHEEQCPARQAECRFCKDVYPAEIMQEHMQICNKRPRQIFIPEEQNQQLQRPPFGFQIRSESPLMGRDLGLVNPFIRINRGIRLQRHRPFITVLSNSGGRNFDPFRQLIAMLLRGMPQSDRQDIQDFKGKPFQGEKQGCSICLCDVQKGEQSVQLPCKHIYHPNCINRWIKQSSKCPQCRKHVLEGS